MTTYVMVLNDGETFTDINGCAILAVPDEADTDVESVEEFMEHDHPGSTVAFFTVEDGVPVVNVTRDHRLTIGVDHVGTWLGIEVDGEPDGSLATSVTDLFNETIIDVNTFEATQ